LILFLIRLLILLQISGPYHGAQNFSSRATFAVAILEIKNRGATAGQGKSMGANINVYLVWSFFVILKFKLLWLTLSNPTEACGYC